MKRNPSLTITGIAVFVLMAILLTYPAKCLIYSLYGLQLWFEKMIPALFPFMILSGIMIRLNLAEPFARLLSPVLAPVFRVRSICLYVMVISFLCGFPMGAQSTALLYERKQITKAEATYLLAFCNNIGPVYFLSFVLPTLELSVSVFLLFGMYGLPLLYGCILRHTYFRTCLPATPIISKDTWVKQPPSLLVALDESIWTALGSIAKLGGYMIFFNLLFVIPELILQITPNNSPNQIQILRGMCGCLLEITGGIGLLGSKAPWFVLCILPFGGLSCMAQTYSMIRSTDLSLAAYLIHKIILTFITFSFYLFVRVLN